MSRLLHPVVIVGLVIVALAVVFTAGYSLGSGTYLTSDGVSQEQLLYVPPGPLGIQGFTLLNGAQLRNGWSVKDVYPQAERPGTDSPMGHVYHLVKRR